LDKAKALIIARGKTRFFRFNLLYYPVVKWMIRAMEAAGISEAVIVCDGKESFEGVDFSGSSCQVKLNCISDFAGTTEAFKYAGELFADFDGPVLVFDAPMPALTASGLTSLLSGRFSVLMSEVLTKESYDDIRVLYMDAKELQKAIAGAPDLSVTGLSAFCPRLSFASFEHTVRREEFSDAKDMMSLALLENMLKQRMCRDCLTNDIYIQSPDNTFLSPTVKIEPGAQILTGSILYGDTHIGKDAVIGPNALISSSKIGANTTVNASQVYDSTVGDDTKVGPFAYIRPGCAVGSHVRIGDFVELKKATIGDGTKVSHLTYIGDAEVGKNVNFGCGTVTVNYDGNGKYLTRVEDGAFIGCNTNLVAPVTVHKGAYTAAGTTVTKDVPADALSIGRCRETIKENWSLTHKEKK